VVRYGVKCDVARIRRYIRGARGDMPIAPDVVERDSSARRCARLRLCFVLRLPRYHQNNHRERDQHHNIETVIDAARVIVCASDEAQ